jgi:hypothetical protein
MLCVIINKKGSAMIKSLKAIYVILIFAAFSMGAHAQTKVVAIPMSGDDLKPLANIITVAKENGDFDGPVAAINAIGNSLPIANEENPYLIVIAPGVYNLSEQLVMKEYVSVSGSGQHVIKLTGSIASSGGTSSALVVGKDNTSLRGFNY